MLRFSLALDTVYTSLTMYARIGRAARHGFSGVEICRGYKGLSAALLRKAAQENGVRLVNLTINNPWDNTLNKSYHKLLPEFESAFAFAAKAGFESLVVLGGERQSPLDAPKALIAENLKRVASLAQQHKINVLIEPLNNIMEHRGQYLVSSVEAAEIIRIVASPRVKMLYDFYHMQVMEGNLLHNLSANLDVIHHLHLSGIPGHDEPFHCEIDYPYVLRKLEENGYAGYVGAEYMPSYVDEVSLQDTMEYLNYNTGGKK